MLEGIITGVIRGIFVGIIGGILSLVFLYLVIIPIFVKLGKLIKDANTVQKLKSWYTKTKANVIRKLFYKK